MPEEFQNSKDLNYKVQSAVLLLIFNRPDVTLQAFEQIKKAAPGRLYIAADGPRSNVASDILLCKKARSVTEKIDWGCDVKTFFKRRKLRL